MEIKRSELFCITHISVSIPLSDEELDNNLISSFEAFSHSFLDLSISPSISGANPKSGSISSTAALASMIKRFEAINK